MVSIPLPEPWNVYAGRFRPVPAVLGQVHRLNAQAASAGAPRVPVAYFFEGETMPALPLAVSAPVLGAPALTPIVCFTANVPAPRPVLGRPAIGQEHRIAPRPLACGRPQFLRPRLGEPPHVLGAIGLTVAAPIASMASLVAQDRLLTVIGVSSRRQLTPIVGQRTAAAVIHRQSSAALVGQHSRPATIAGRKPHAVI